MAISQPDAQSAVDLINKVLRGVQLTAADKTEARRLVGANATPLTACPFCGHADTLRVAGPSGAVTCDTCGTVGPQPSFNPDAVTGWNTRA